VKYNVACTTYHIHKSKYFHDPERLVVQALRQVHNARVAASQVAFRSFVVLGGRFVVIEAYLRANL
jgi:hypothetical protein